MCQSLSLKGMGLVSRRSAEWVVMAGREVGWWWSGWRLRDTGAGSRGRAVNTFHDPDPVHFLTLGFSLSLATSFCVALG